MNRLLVSFLLLFLSLQLITSKKALPAGKLQVLSFTPTDDSKGVYTIAGKNSITVAFNRAVIPLGYDWDNKVLPTRYSPFVFSPVTPPGLFRWVTTSIGVFYPETSWPSDLTFNVTINKDLLTFDNEKLSTPDQKVYAFQTPKLRVIRATASSRKAARLTENQWSANQRVEFPKGNISNAAHPEVPPDGFLQVYFSEAINVEEIAKQLRIEFVSSHLTRPKTTVPSFKLHNCTSHDGLNISFSSALSRATLYQLVLPAGSRYGSLTGPLSADLKIPFYGLHLFRFSFKAPTKWDGYEANNLFSLFLPHGLAKDSTTLEELKKSISFNPPVVFQLQRASLAAVQITGDFKVNTSYEIIVTSNINVRDGFGGRLYGSKGVFGITKTAPLSYFAAASSTSNRILVPESFNTTWKYLVSSDGGCTQPTLEVQNIMSGDILGALLSVSGYADRKMLMLADDVSLCSKGVVDIKQSYFGMSNTIGICERNAQNQYRYTYYVSRTSLAATVFAGHNETLVWVTSIDSNVPVKGVSVKAFQNGVPVSQATTDEQGRAVLTVTKGFQVVLEKDGKAVAMPDNFYNQQYVSNDFDTALVVSDRALYLPGDLVNMKIYFRKPISSTDTFELTATLQDLARNPVTIKTPFIVSNYSLGTGFATLTIPSGTFFSDYTITLVPMMSSSGSTSFLRSYGSVSIKVAEPRIPTVTTSLTSQKKVLDQQKGVEISFSSRFYFGTPLPNYPVQISWQKTSGAFSRGWRSLTWWNWRTVMPEEVTGLDWVTKLADKKDEKTDDNTNTNTNTNNKEAEATSGVFALTTDSDGKLTYKLQTPKGVNNGDTIEVVSKLMSPTGELLEKSVSLPVQSSEWSIAVSSTSSEVVPGHSIAFFAKAKTCGSPVNSSTVITGTIYRWNKQKITEDMLNDKSSDLNTNKQVSRCTFTSSQSKYPQCHFRVPHQGNYVAVFSVTDPEGTVVHTGYPFGKNAEEWEREPLYSLKGISITLNSTKYSIGDVAGVNFLSPFESAMMLIKWGNLQLSKTKIVTLEKSMSNKLIEIPVQIGEECAGGCTFAFAVHAPQQPNSFVPKLPVPISPIFDWSGPLSMTSTMTPEIIEKDDTMINIRTTGKEIASPGETVSFHISLTDSRGRPTDAEIAVFVVDKSILDLAPPADANLNQHIKQRAVELSYQLSSSNSAFVTQQTYEKTLSLLLEKIKNNAKFLPSWKVKSTWNDPWLNFNASAVDPPPVSFLTLQSAMMASVRTGGFGPEFAMPMAMNSMSKFSAMNVNSVGGEAAYADSASVASKPAGSSDNVELRADTVFCPYFNPNMKTRNGKGNFQFKLPANIGQFSIKIFARNVKSAGNAETQIKSRKPVVNLLPVAPRIVRYGDAFRTGVTLSLTDARWTGELQVSLSLSDCSLLDIGFDGTTTWNKETNVITQTVKVMSNTSPRALFTFFAIKRGTAVLRYTVSSADQSVVYDKLQVSIPVEGLQENVYVGTSFSASQANTENETLVSEGIALPAAIPGSGSLVVESGVGRLPSVQSITGRLTDRLLNGRTFEPSAQDLLANLIGKFILRKYKAPSADLVNRTDLAYDLAIRSLPSYTSDKFGLRWFSSGNYIDEYLNAYGLIINQILKSIGAPELPQQLTSTWEKVLIQSISSPNRNIHLSIESLSMFAVATDKLPAVHLMNLTSAKPESLSTSSKLFLSWKLFSTKTNVNLAKKLLEMVMNKIRVQGRTAYIAIDNTANADVTATTLFLYVASVYHPSNPLLDKIANYIAQGGRSSGGLRYSGYYFGNQQSVYSILGLTTYDISRSNNNPNVALKVSVGESSLITAKFDNKKLVDHFKSTFDDVLAKSSDNIRFAVSGAGEVSVAIGLDFCPEKISPEPYNRGIQLTKIYQLADTVKGHPIGKPLTNFQVGQEVIVTIEITLLDDVSNLMIIDPLPTGLEASEKEATTAARCFVPFSFFRCSYYWMPYFTREVRPDKVRFFANQVNAGTHSVSYKAVVVTEGQFVIPPVKAEDVAHPETMGLSAGGNFLTTQTIAKDSRRRFCQLKDLE